MPVMPNMNVKNVLMYFRSVFICAYFCLMINGASGCFDNGWGCLGSDWLSELCPVLDVLGSAVTDLFKTHSIRK